MQKNVILKYKRLKERGQGMDLFKENLYKVLTNPSREAFIDAVFNGVGEQDNLDFKESWTDYQKIAEIVLGMANIGGGTIVVGVKEINDGTLEAVGVTTLEDKEKLHSKIYNLLPDTVKFDIYNFDFTDESYDKIKGKMFQILVVNSNNIDLPYVLRKNTNDAEEGCIFYRRGTKTVKANTQEIREMIHKRLDAEELEKSNLELEEHLKQLRTLYDYMKPLGNSSLYINQFLKNVSFGNLAKLYDNRSHYYPEENYDQFIAKMIEKKKIKIEKVLDLG